MGAVNHDICSDCTSPVFESDVEHDNRSKHCQDKEASNAVTDWGFYDQTKSI